MNLEVLYTTEHSRRENTVFSRHVGGPSLRVSQLVVWSNTQSHCYPWIFPAPHKEVHNINKTYTVHTPPFMSWPGVFMSSDSMLSSSSNWPCHRLVFVSRTHFDFVFMLQKVRGSISGSKLGFHGSLCFLTRPSLSIKTKSSRFHFSFGVLPW